MGNLNGTLPVTSKAIAVFLLIVNIVFPGLATVMMCCLTKEFTSINIFIGILQAILSLCFIGWIWSIIWGILVLELASDDVKERIPLNDDFSMKNHYNSIHLSDKDSLVSYSNNNKKY